MNVGSVKYHPGGPNCTYKGEKVPSLVEFSEGGGISGHILTNLLMHLDDLKFYDNDRKNGIVPEMLVDWHGSRFDMFFKYTYVMKITNGPLFLVFLMEQNCGK